MWKKWLLVVGIIILVFIAIVACKMLKGDKQEETAEASSSITAGENQKLLSGQITAINGNEIIFLSQSGEEETMMISVGTNVHTKLGTTTTFSRLAAGDEVSLLVEDDEAEAILEVWITA